MANDDHIGYSGPTKEWGPLPQSRGPSRARGRIINDGRYSSIELLRRNLGILKAESADTIREAEESLRSFNLNIDSDTSLEKAQQAEWPATLGNTKNYVTYAQNKTMIQRVSRGSNYIHKEYNNAIRGAWGTPAADVAQFSSGIHSEAIRIENFLDDYISEVSNEQSQQRAIELLHDWTLKAIESSGQFRHILAAKDQRQQRYTQSDLDKTTPAQAKQYQAILQVQLNQTASSVQEIQEDLSKHLGANAELYYDGYLGPALKFRRQISSSINSPSSSSKIVQEMHQASAVLDDNTQVLLADLMKRNQIFADKSIKLFARVGEGELRRKSIKDLAIKGKLPKNPFRDLLLDPEELEHFEIEYEGWINEIESQATPNYSNEAYATQPSNRFESPHSDLAGRTDELAHPQYLLKDGGTITGNIFVEDGVKIDGVDVSAHAHTGNDGSFQINGSSITAGTLPTTAFDNSDNSDGIADFRLVGYDTSVTIVGDTIYEATLAWEGDDGKQFEIQVARVT